MPPKLHRSTRPYGMASGEAVRLPSAAQQFRGTRTYTPVKAAFMGWHALGIYLNEQWRHFAPE